jgi:hypothetical protein
MGSELGGGDAACDGDCALMVFVGCSPTASPVASSAVPSQFVSISSAPPAAPTPMPTPNPEALRVAAAAAYKTAAATVNAGFKALHNKYPKFTSLTVARAYWKGAVKLEGAFIAAVKKIAWPPDTAGDAHTLLVRETSTQEIEIEGTVVKSWAQQTNVQSAWNKATRLASAAANQVRSDLGLPPVPAQ